MNGEIEIDKKSGNPSDGLPAKPPSLSAARLARAVAEFPELAARCELFGLRLARHGPFLFSLYGFGDSWRINLYPMSLRLSVDRDYGSSRGAMDGREGTDGLKRPGRVTKSGVRIYPEMPKMERLMERVREGIEAGVYDESRRAGMERRERMAKLAGGEAGKGRGGKAKAGGKGSAKTADPAKSREWTLGEVVEIAIEVSLGKKAGRKSVVGRAKGGKGTEKASGSGGKPGKRKGAAKTI
jgi:hypothetical protein